MPQEAQSCLTHRVCCPCRSTPRFNFTPGTLILEEGTRDDFVGNVRTRERPTDLGYTAGRAIRQPFFRRHGFVIECGYGLQVEHHHRSFRCLDHGQHDGGGGVGGRINEKNIYLGGGQPIASTPSRLVRVRRSSWWEC